MGRKATQRCSRPSPFGDTTTPSVFGIRLLALPRDVLRTVLRLAGRPARGACRALRDGYGPLDGGLYLEHFTHSRGCRLRDLTATSSPGGYRSILTLVLHPHPSTTSLGYALLRPLPASFPALCTLHLADSITLNSSLIHHLAPLAPHLTSLTATFADLTSLATLANTLTSLHELGLDNVACTISDAFSTLRPLAPVLLRLTCTQVAARSTAAEVLRSLAAFTGLTHLALPGLATTEWDQEAVDLLATAMPRLQALKFQYFQWSFPDNPHLANNIWAALARRTALTTLTTTCTQLPSSPPPLRLAQLSLLTTSTPDGPVPLLEALAPSQTLTSLEVTGRLAPRPRDVHALCRFADTLQSLAWNGHAASLAALLPLSQLTRLESLSLSVAAPGNNTEHLPGEQAASAIAAALPRLTSLQLQSEYVNQPPHHHLAALLGAVARQGTLRHLALGCWDLQWGSSLLAPLATSLARLTLPSPHHNVLPVVESVSSLQALRCLRLRGTTLLVLQAAGVPLPVLQAVYGPVGSTSSTAPSGRGQHAGSQRAAGGPDAAGEGEAGALRVQLPPGLRQLCMETLPTVEWRLEARVMEALLAAAARQDCVVRVDGAEPPLSSVRLPQHDDCHGYREGASAEWVEAHRPHQEERSMSDGMVLDG